MSAYSGAQGKGAARKRREEKRLDALERDAHTRADRRADARRRLHWDGRYYRCHNPDGSPGKVVLFTEAEARAELVDTILRANRGNARRKECRFYPCETCGFFHLTSQPAQPKEKRSA